MKVQLSTFFGKRPKTAPHLLDPEYSQVAQNVDAETGALAPWRGLSAVADLTSTYDPSSTYAIGDRVVYNAALWVCSTTISTPESWDPAHWSQVQVKTIWEYAPDDITQYWLVSDQQLNIAASVFANDTYKRTYFTGETEPRYLANNNLSSPFDPFKDYIKLGVPAGANSSMSFVSGNTGGTNYRAYIYTFVNEYGEEGPPARKADGSIDILETTTYLSGNIVITGFASPAAKYGIIDHASPRSGKVRLYRTNASITGVAQFQFVKDTDIDSATNFASLSITDDVADEDLGDIIPSVTWDPPPTELLGLIGLSNGVMAGFVGNTVWLSEAFVPHAWPYSISFDETIVALGYFGTTVVVLTEGFPYLINVVDPSLVGKSKISSFHPCLSRAGVVVAENSVIYPTTEGLCRISQDGATVVTAKVITPSQWEDIYNPASISGVWFGGKYFGFYTTGSADRRGFLLDFINANFTDLVTNQNFYCGFVSRVLNKLCFLRDNPLDSTTRQITAWNDDTVNYMYYTWKSKQFIMPATTNFSCCRVLLDSTKYQAVVQAIDDNAYLASLNQTLWTGGELEGALNAAPFNEYTINGDILFDLTDINMSGNVTFILYVDGVQKFAKVITTDKPFRLPSGYKGRRIEIELQGYIPVYEVRMAQGMRELET